VSSWKDDPELVRDAGPGVELEDQRWDRAFQLLLDSGVMQGVKAIPGSGMFMRAMVSIGKRGVAQDPEGARSGLVQFIQQVAAVLEIEPSELFPPDLGQQ